MLKLVAHTTALRRSAAAVLFSLATLAAGSAGAGVLEWDISGQGRLSDQQDGARSTLGYSLEGPDVYTQQTWSATAFADRAGDYSFNWNYSGYHAFFIVTAFLYTSGPSGGAVLVNQGPAVCCSMPSGGFGYTGTYTFTDVKAGDMLSFHFGGGNFDADARMFGTLVLEQKQSDVPEPASVALFGLGLAGVAALRRRKGR